MNKLAIFGLVFISILGLTLAASFGMFRASVSEPIAIEADLSEMVAEPYGLLAEESEEALTLSDAEAESKTVDVEAQAALEAARETQQAVADKGAARSDLALQEIRDAYVTFPQAFPDVVIKYEVGNQCGTKDACVVGDHEILVTHKLTADTAIDHINLTLARQHATLAVARAVDSNPKTKRDLEMLLPACLVQRDYELYAAAATDEVAPLPAATGISTAALSDIIVHNMTGSKDPQTIYPFQFHTPEQIRAAEDVAVGQSPEIVVQVASPKC